MKRYLVATATLVLVSCGASQAAEDVSAALEAANRAEQQARESANVAWNMARCQTCVYQTCLFGDGCGKESDATCSRLSEDTCRTYGCDRFSFNENCQTFIQICRERAK